ncbi:SDR family oxidoreductase [Verrucomicrobia bacterium]|nr:SDR family oxidoreductase [Verrucomicrobiota bacterium]
MKLKPGLKAVVTGASGGLGTVITMELAKQGIDLSLVAFPGKELEQLKATVEESGVNAHYTCADLRDPGEQKRAIQEAKEAMGGIDILINNAGVEFTCPMHELTEDELESVLRLNLEAPMRLTRLVLPEMLDRKRGHIVNISSLAGKSGPALQEPYAATKAGLIGFTASFRASYRGTGVSASAICPGFVEAGIYERLKNRTGLSAPALLGTSKPIKVAQAVIKAINADKPQIIVNPLPVKPLFMLGELSPSLQASVIRWIGAHRFFRKVYEKDKEESAS